MFRGCGERSKANMPKGSWVKLKDTTSFESKRVIAVCLRPLEQLASRLGEGLGNSVDKPAQLSNQLLSPTDSPLDMKCLEQLSNFKVCVYF